MSAEPGLRERKKQQMRRAIAEAALGLFAERGFDAVTVAEVARAADVSEGTVFNYFPTKEDLFYGQMESFEEALVDAVRDRPPGEAVLPAFRRFVLEGSRGLAEQERAELISTATRIVGASGALRAREREIVERATLSLADLIAADVSAAPSDVEPLVVASALMGAQRALVERVRASVLAGKSGRELEGETRAHARRAFARLERGLAGYGVRPSR